MEKVVWLVNVAQQSHVEGWELAHINQRRWHHLEVGSWAGCPPFQPELLKNWGYRRLLRQTTGKPDPLTQNGLSQNGLSQMGHVVAHGHVMAQLAHELARPLVCQNLLSGCWQLPSWTIKTLREPYANLALLLHLHRWGPATQRKGKNTPTALKCHIRFFTTVYLLGKI